MEMLKIQQLTDSTPDLRKFLFVEKTSDVFPFNSKFKRILLNF